MPAADGPVRHTGAASGLSVDGRDTQAWLPAGSYLFLLMFSFLQSFLEIDEREATFARRGFVCGNPEAQDRLEQVGRTFLRGYHAALFEEGHGDDQTALAQRLDENHLEFRGFAYEGAAMALFLDDALSLRGGRFPRFVAGAGQRHVYLLHVGAGWACARLPWLRRRMEAAIAGLHPVLGWLTIDGYGFHEGYFHWKTRMASRKAGAALSGPARHVFFQGLGRSLWFVQGADAERIAAAITAMAPQYHGDAWSGVGLACAYAGGMAIDELSVLRSRSGAHAAALAQGAAFAAKARRLAGNPAKHTEVACAAFCHMSADHAAALCDETFNQLSNLHPCPYQQWRTLLQDFLLSHTQLTVRGKNYEPNKSPELAATKSS